MLLTVVLEKTLESPLDCKEIQPVHLKGDQSWVFIGRTDAEADFQYFGHLMWRADSFEKTLILGKIEDRRQRGQQRMKWLDGITDSMDMFGWTLGVRDGQWGLAYYGSWGRKESDTTEHLNSTELNVGFYSLQVLCLDHVFLDSTLDLTLAKKPFLSFLHHVTIRQVEML